MAFVKLILDDIQQWTHVDAYDKVSSKFGLHLVSKVLRDQDKAHPKFKPFSHISSLQIRW